MIAPGLPPGASLSMIVPLSDTPQKRRRDRSPESPAAAPSKALCPDCGDKHLGEPPDRCIACGRELCYTCLKTVMVRCFSGLPSRQKFRPAMLPRGATRDQPAGRLPGRRTCVCDHRDCRRLLEVFNRANCLSKADASPAGVAAVASPAGEVRCWGGGPWARRPPELARGPRQWCWGAGGAEPLWCWRGVLAWWTPRGAPAG